MPLRITLNNSGFGITLDASLKPLQEIALMKRALCSFLFAGLVLSTSGYSQQPRLQLVPAPVGSSSAPAFEAHPSPLNIPGAQFPRIEADSRVTFHLKAPDAQKVQVSINNKPFDMTKGDDGVWTYTSEPQAAGYHNYWMIVDGAITLDPGTNAFIGFGHMCNGFEVPDPGVDFYDLKDVPHGNILVKNYYSKVANKWRHIFVYTPPGYDKSTAQRYPVLYLQHGGGEDERVWTEMGHTNLILDNLLAEGKVKPMIVVMETSAVGPPMPMPAAPPAAPAAGAAPRPAGGGFRGFPPGGGPYGDLMINDLIPWVDSNFRTVSDKDHRAMAGLSMGGMITEAVGMSHPEKFAYIGLFSGNRAAMFGQRTPSGQNPDGAKMPPLDLKTLYNGAMADPAKFNKEVKVFFFSCGSLENPRNLETHQQQLVDAGIKNSYVYVSPGTAHEWQTWRRSLYVFAPMLFR
jgi:enterochelin esterase-like enzyme